MINIAGSCKVNHLMHQYTSLVAVRQSQRDAYFVLLQSCAASGPDIHVPPVLSLVHLSGVLFQHHLYAWKLSAEQFTVPLSVQIVKFFMLSS
jgi:hypothetical protein